MSKRSEKVAIVTGASSAKGIGFAIAKQLAAAECTLVLTDLSSTQSELDARVSELSTLGANVRSMVVDLSNIDDIERCTRQTLEHYERVDILVNNAGIGCGDADYMANHAKDFTLAYTINVLGPALFCQAVLPTMIEQKSGVIVNIASLCGLGAIEDIPAPYTASKFAAVGLSKSIALQYAEHGIRCNAVCPGVVNTQMREKLLCQMAKDYKISTAEAEDLENATIAMQRGAEADEVASVVAFLTSPASQYMTGVALPVAGGLGAGL